MDLLRRRQKRCEFEGFVSANVNALLRTGYLITSDLAKTEDLVEECLLRVARQWPRVRTLDRPDAYARKVLVDLTLDGAPKPTGRPARLADESAAEQLREAGARDFASLEMRGDLLDALHGLTDRERAIVVLCYFGDFSEAQTAEALSCSIATVESATSRALVRLRPHPRALSCSIATVKSATSRALVRLRPHPRAGGRVPRSRRPALALRRSEAGVSELLETRLRIAFAQRAAAIPTGAIATRLCALDYRPRPSLLRWRQRAHDGGRAAHLDHRPRPSLLRRAIIAGGVAVATAAGHARSRTPLRRRGR